VGLRSEPGSGLLRDNACGDFEVRRLNGFTVLFLVLAALWGVLQFVLAFFVHVTSRGHETSAGWVVPPTKTYMQADGVSEVVLTLVILALVGAVGANLHRRVTRGLQGAGGLAWAVSVVTLALGVVGFVYAFGVGICLLLACASVSRHGAASAAERPAVTGGRTG